MSTIYSAGQYDDAFSPKRLGNWDSGAKESYPFIKSTNQYTPRIIVDSRGHLLPWVPRGDRSSLWGLLNCQLRNKYNRARSMALMSGPGKQATTLTHGANNQSFTIRKRLRKIPKFAPRKVDNSSTQDLLQEYIQQLGLPIVWIIGPFTRYTFKKRKLFCKQLATSLGFGYVNLDEKVQEWKERQQVCTCDSPLKLDITGGGGGGVPSFLPTGPLHSLASTSIAPSKLPTSVPPFISPNIPTPPRTSLSEANEYVLNILESQRITFDTALPIGRNKILELYKFAMAECLPCGGFIMDSVPFDLVEGLQFEKVFYPAALAIYFTEGVPQRKQKVKPKDRRVTASTATSMHTGTKKNLMTPLEYMERNRKLGANVYLRPRSHKRLGVFSLAEGDKICKQFGSKTIRIINAEDVETDTMEFLNELVKKNLDRYRDIIEGHAGLEFEMGVNQVLPDTVEIIAAPKPKSSIYTSPFVHKNEALGTHELDRVSKSQQVTEGAAEERMPPALVTAHRSESSLFTIPYIFTPPPSDSSLESSVVASPRTPRGEQLDLTENRTETTQCGIGLCAENVYIPGRRSAQLWEKIVTLESKVAELSTQEETSQRQQETYFQQQHQQDQYEEENGEEDTIDVVHIPPPSAYAEGPVDKEEEKKFTAAIRNAIGPHYITPLDSDIQYIHPHQLMSPGVDHVSSTDDEEYDYGASGDRCSANPTSMPLSYPQQKKCPPVSHGKRQTNPNSYPYPAAANDNNFEEDSFYD